MKSVIIEKKSDDELKKIGVLNWGIWTKEKSIFDWYYDSDEQCYILDGRVIVHTAEGDYEIKRNDFVTFKKGLKCKWEILENIRKHYNFV